MSDKKEAPVLIRVLLTDNLSCHACGEPLERDTISEKEWCVNKDCQVYLHHFNTPTEYVEPDEIGAGLPKSKPAEALTSEPLPWV